VNPGFETGTLTGWAPSGGSSVVVVSSGAHGGTYAVKDETTTAYFQQAVLPFVPGATYRFTGWYRNTKGFCRIIIQTGDDGGQLGFTYSPGSSSSSWQQASVTATVEGNATWMNVAFQSIEGDCLWDDFTLTKL
jgi:hypothetical protein